MMGFKYFQNRFISVIVECFFVDFKVGFLDKVLVVVWFLVLKKKQLPQPVIQFV